MSTPDDRETSLKPRQHRRPKVFPVRFRCHMTTDLHDAILAEADSEDTSAAAVARDAIARGLPLMRDARRKRTRSQSRNHNGSAAAA